MSVELIEKKKRIVEHYLKQKILLSKQVMLELQQPNKIEELYQNLSIVQRPQTVVPTTAFSSSSGRSPYTVVVKKMNDAQREKYAVHDFVSCFLKRYAALEKMLRPRSELQNVTSIRRLQQKQEKETVTVIGYVYDKRMTKNGNIMFTLEDPTGFLKVIVSKTSSGFTTALDTELDEVVGVVGSLGDACVFANQVIYPDIPLATEIKKSPDEVFAAVLSCVHVGSRLFLPERFNNFIEWLNGRYGSQEEREIAARVGYVFIIGDIVDGVGIFPSQESELTTPDIYQQYRDAADYLRRIPPEKQVIYATGNHDACRIAEPQPRIYQDYAPDLYTLPNLTIVTNPSMVTINKSTDFSGFNCLLYHGFSYTHYCDTVQSIKNSGLPISDRTGLIMKYLLQRRHLAPTYGSTQFVPHPDEDCLVIDEVPDLFLSGHIHKAVITTYRGVSLVAGSCFQSHSAYQEKFGHTPIPGQVPLINLKTRKVSLVEF